MASFWKNVNLDNFTENEIILASIDEAVAYKLQACFILANHIPNFISGIKVQVFHGLEWKKKVIFRLVFF